MIRASVSSHRVKQWDVEFDEEVAMSEATSYKIHCSECLKPVPDEAEYCPFCGRAVMASTRADRVRRQFGTEIVDSDELSEQKNVRWRIWERLSQFRRETYLAVAVVAAFLLGGAAFVWIAFGSFFGGGGTVFDGVVGELQAQSEEQGDESSEGSNEAPRTGSGPADIGAFSYEVGTDERVDHQTATIAYEGEQLLRLYTPNQTGYENLENRTMGVSMRLEWIARRHAALTHEGERPEVVVRERGESWEVAWSDGDAAYRIVRVHSEDARHWNLLPGRNVTRRELAETYAEDVRQLFDRLVDTDSRV